MSVPQPSTTSLDPTELLTRLSLEEKAALLDGSDFWHTQGVERLGIPAVMLTDGPHGLRKQTDDPDTLGLDRSVPATCFPPAAGLASTWDTTLLRRVGRALGDECRASRVGVLLGPGINMKRTPLCGRNFEYFSEDPLLAGELAAALVEGVQERGVGTSLKHFAANNQETARQTISAEVDERTLREIYLPAFETVVRRSQPWTVMCAYNRVNGVYASQNPWLLTTVLREEWGFEGLVMSDWGAVDDRALAVAAGLDLEMPSSGGIGTRAVLQAVHDGRLTEAQVDVAVERVLRLIARAHGAITAEAEFDTDAHHRLAHEAAVRSAVLLKNDGGLLPLTGTGRVAVVGELARTPRYQGAGSSQVNPTRLDDALSALRTRIEDLTFAPGYRLDAGEADPDLVEEAVEVARDADVVVLFLGLPAAEESEGFDREHIDLPAQQLTLLEAMTEVHDQVVVVLSNGGVVALDPWQNRVAAVLEGWLLGQAGGSAVADLLLGLANPSGRLAETIPVRFLDNPTVGGFPGENGVVRYGEGLLIGYRWYDTRELAVAYPFGHGLSYTSFAYTDATAVPAADGSARVEVSVTVRNTGDRAGREVVQVYVADPTSRVFRPAQELRGFASVDLDAGESQGVTIDLGPRAFAYWDTAPSRWVVEGGTFEIRVGASSRDIRCSVTVELTGDDLARPLGATSPAEDWLAHPEAGPALLERLGGLAAVVNDVHLGPLVRPTPLIRLTRLPGSALTESDVAALEARYGRTH